MIRPILFLFAYALFTAGCARFEPRPLSPAATASKLEERSLTNAVLQTFLEKNLGRSYDSWPPASWTFEMLTLAALHYHPALEVARAEWAVAQGGERTAEQRPNPTLTVTPGYNSTTITPSPWIPLTFLDLPIETAGKRSYRRAKAVHLSQAARLKMTSAAWQVRSDLRAALLRLQAAERRQVLLRRQIELQEQILARFEQQAQAGAIAGSEVLPMRISLIKLRLEQADNESNRVEARARLAEAVAVPLRSLDGMTIAYDSLEQANSEGNLDAPENRRAALLSRADILTALAEYEASQAALQLEIAKQYPDVRLQPGYQYDQGDNKWSLGLVVDLPVLNQNQGPIAEARAHRREAAARFEALQSRVLADLERSTESARQAQQTASVLRSLVQAETQRRDSIAAQFQAGAVDQLELLNAQAALAVAEVVLLDGQLKFRQAMGALEDAVQRPFPFSASVFESSGSETPLK